MLLYSDCHWSQWFAYLQHLSHLSSEPWTRGGYTAPPGPSKCELSHFLCICPVCYARRWLPWLNEDSHTELARRSRTRALLAKVCEKLHPGGFPSFMYADPSQYQTLRSALCNQLSSCSSKCPCYPRANWAVRWHWCLGTLLGQISCWLVFLAQNKQGASSHWVFIVKYLHS